MSLHSLAFAPENPGQDLAASDPGSGPGRWADDQPTCNLWYIRRRLGRDGEHGYGERRMVSYVRLLIREHDFPQPLPTLRKSALTGEVCAKSNWLRPAVDAWLDAMLPPEADAALDRAARLAASAEMDQAARNLRLVPGAGE